MIWENLQMVPVRELLLPFLLLKIQIHYMYIFVLIKKNNFVILLNLPINILVNTMCLNGMEVSVNIVPGLLAILIKLNTTICPKENIVLK